MRYYSVCLLAALCLCAPILHSQEVKHAPTVEQCQADDRLWRSKLELGPADVGYKELDGWGAELRDCRKVDPDNEGRYFDTSAGIITEQFGRLLHFVLRHHLWEQFLAEDAQGKR